MEFLSTPQNCFANLVDYPFAEHFIQVSDNAGGELNLHYVDEGPKDGEVVLMLHGEPSWSYLYRHMITPVVDAGYRVIAPDLIGFGKSDKPTEQGAYTYQTHVDWIRALLLTLKLSEITLVCQDWGGLIGLRLVAEHPDLFARVLAANTMLPTGDHALPEAFHKWKDFSQQVEIFPVAGIIKGATTTSLSESTLAAYNAPFPDESYKAGVRQFPLLVPATPNDPATAANRKAWQVLQRFNKPFITAFSDSDPVTAGGDDIMQKLIPGCQGQHHTTIINGGHFLQEDQPQALTKVLLDFMQANPICTQ
ncbi:haloalkane dehalogenase [Paraglaciecola hydrolytica]|uniref:Haloalkane dehalogenase n=1 Tax=Paraglaciecola hydrolytica TaxID=1799789 RepID=A0A136A0J7_9ALTE|nr:haloalkane dehalogenase [Paraglaciecola hydrolytica]KXI28742.1 haloalkane dehalogenase [Paraglaciecola hydrolytica]